MLLFFRPYVAEQPEQDCALCSSLAVALSVPSGKILPHVCVCVASVGGTDAERVKSYA